MNTSVRQKSSITLEEAEELLPSVELLFRRLQVYYNALVMLDDVEIEVEDETYIHDPGVTKFNKEFHKLSYQFYSTLERLERMNCWIKDIDEGLVDFKSQFQGRDIFLCWKIGEHSIRYWHELDDGFAGRKKIVDLKEYA